MERNVYKPLLKSGYSVEFLENTDIEIIFIRYLDYLDSCLIEQAERWVTDKLNEIERKVNEKIELPDGKSREKTDIEKDVLRRELYDKEFRGKK